MICSGANPSGWAHTCANCNQSEPKNQMHLATILFLSLLCHLCLPFWQKISFFLFMPINFNIIHTCVSIQNTNAYKVLNESQQYFHLAAIFVLSHLCSLMYSLIKDILLGLIFFMHACKHIYVCTYIHTYMHPCSSAFIHSCIYAYIQVCLHDPAIHSQLCTYRFMYVSLHTCIYTCIESYKSAYTNT